MSAAFTPVLARLYLLLFLGLKTASRASPLLRLPQNKTSIPLDQGPSYNSIFPNPNLPSAPSPCQGASVRGANRPGAGGARELLPRPGGHPPLLCGHHRQHNSELRWACIHNLQAIAAGSSTQNSGVPGSRCCPHALASCAARRG